jgi:hypothetical protein
MLVGVNHGDIDLRAPLVGWIAKAVAYNAEHCTNEEHKVGAGMLQAFPQWGHFALACSRLLPQCAQGTTLPCGLENT